MDISKEVTDWREFGPGEVEDARGFYLKHGPGEGKARRIIRDMHDAGWLHFQRIDLKGSEVSGFAGLEKLMGWRDEWHAREQERIQEEMTRRRAAYLARNEARKAEAVANDESDSDEDDPDDAPAAEDADESTSSVLATNEEPTVDFPTWLEAGRPKWKWRWRFQRVIYKELDKITAGTLRRLMIFIPPRHGKSELVTIRYSAWRLLKDPKLRIIVGSYNQRLANRFSRYIKAIYQYGPRIELSEMDEPRDLTLNTMDEWETYEGGGVKAVGAGAGVTGFGADLIIIDDPVKNRAEAESKNQRDRVWDWFTDDLMTRLEPNGAVILIQTRWHEDDLAGRLLALRRRSTGRVLPGQNPARSKGTGQDWKVIQLPALAEENDPLNRKPGQALCHARFPRQELLKKQEEMGSYSFAALYQQRPAPAEGALFKREWFSRIVDRAPEGLRWFRGYDLAVSTKTSADYTASFRCALDKRTGDLYIADGFRARLEFPDQRKYIVGRIRDERDTEHGIELALHGEAFIQELWREERLSRHAFRGVRVTTDKFTRALAWANRAEAGRVVLVRGPWIEAFLDEATAFPNAAHDDQIDAVSLAVQMMEARKYRTMAF